MFKKAALVGFPTLAGLFLASAAMADGAEDYAFPSCQDERGEQVAFTEDFVGSGTMVLRFNVRYMDDDNLELPTILYDRGFVDEIPDVLRDFSVAHECYHFSSGDARYAYSFRTENRGIPKELHEMIEDNANCAAAHAMREEFNYSPEDIDRLERAISESVSARQAREDMPTIRACFENRQPYPVSAQLVYAQQ